MTLLTNFILHVRMLASISALLTEVRPILSFLAISD